jgi:hypothetical protein
LSLYAYIALALDLGFNTSARTQKKFQKFLNWNISIKLGVLAGIGRDYIPLPLALQKCAEVVVKYLGWRRCIPFPEKNICNQIHLLAIR